ncbi:MAG: sensor histidine kinase [Bacillota bacterium]
MTLRRKMAYEITAMIIGLLLISAASLWGLNGLHQDFGSAIQGYEELRSVYELSSHIATARTLLALPHPDAPHALLEVQTAAAKLNLFTARSPAASRAGQFRSAIESKLATATRLLEIDPNTRNPEDSETLIDSLNDLLSNAANLASDIRHTIEIKQAAADAKRRTTMVAMTLLSATIIFASVIIGTWQYRSVTRPLKRLGDASRRIAAGQFSDRIPAQGPAEFVSLATDFNRMAAELETFYHELERQVAAKSKQLVRSERLASVGYLAAGVAHEVNNPIGIIAGHAELSLQQLQHHPTLEAIPEVERALQVICEEAFRCKEIVAKLLSLARPGDENRRRICLTTIVSSVVSIISGLSTYRSRQVTVQTAQDDDLYILANEGEMKQVLLNLAINALEAVPPQTGQVHISISRVDGFVELAVIDNGRGMPPDVLEHIFEPFFTSKRGASQPGTGLGLSITHAIVESHGGQIFAHSTGPGQGSRFVVRLPAAQPGAAQ